MCINIGDVHQCIGYCLIHLDTCIIFQIKLKEKPNSKSKEDNVSDHLIQNENSSNERLFGEDKSTKENHDEVLLHKQFLYLSKSSLAKARFVYLIVNKRTSSFAPSI